MWIVSSSVPTISSPAGRESMLRIDLECKGAVRVWSQVVDCVDAAIAELNRTAVAARYKTLMPSNTDGQGKLFQKNQKAACSG